MKTALIVLSLIAGVAIACSVVRADDDPAQVEFDDMYEELVRHLRVTSEDGTVTLLVKDVRRRQLTEPVLIKREKNGELAVITCAKEGELAVDSAHRKVYLRLKDSHSLTADGTSAYREDHVIAIELSPSKAAGQPEKPGK